MVMGVEYEAGRLTVPLRATGMAHTASMKALNDGRLWTRKRFMRSIHGSFLPMVDRLASAWRALAMSVRVRWARGRGWSRSNPKSLGLRMAGQMKRRKRKPETLV